jgi:hypothetical protein
MGRRAVPASPEEARQSEEVAEVIPSAIVVDLIDIEVTFKQRDDKHEGRYESLPKSAPEARDSAMIVWGAFELVGTWCA